MTVNELIHVLENCPYKDMEVLFQPSNSSYVDGFGYTAKKKEVRAFWGSNYEAIILTSSGQEGAV